MSDSSRYPSTNDKSDDSSFGLDYLIAKFKACFNRDRDNGGCFCCYCDYCNKVLNSFVGRKFLLIFIFFLMHILFDRAVFDFCTLFSIGFEKSVPKLSGFFLR